MYEKKTRTKFNILDLDFTFVGFNLVWQFYSINFSDILLSFALSLKNCSPKKKTEQAVITSKSECAKQKEEEITTQHQAISIM